MKKKITLSFLAIFAVFAIHAQTASIGGTSYANIQEAITAANPGDVIDITGVHTGVVSFNKGITLRGSDPTTDILQAAATPGTAATRVLNLNANTYDATVENLGIRNGNDASQGGGIRVAKVNGLITFSNLIIENNESGSLGGGIFIEGANTNIINCTVKNNIGINGGGIAAVSSNAVGADNVVNINQSLISGNTAENGGGLYVAGLGNFAKNQNIATNITNTTIFNNTATTGAVGGGAIYCRDDKLTGTGPSNVTLQLIHATIYKNAHTAGIFDGIVFDGVARATNFSMYNSIVIVDEDLDDKALRFVNTNTTEVINCIIGALNGAIPATVDVAANNNEKGRKTSFAGLSSTLSDEGGSTQVITIADGSNSHNYCTATTGITLPTIDQRGAARAGTPDAGAFEFGGTLSINNLTLFDNLSIYPNPVESIITVSGIENIDKISIFSILGKKQIEIYNSNSVNLSNLTSGVYFIKIEKEDRLISKKFVKN